MYKLYSKDYLFSSSIHGPKLDFYPRRKNIYMYINININLNMYIFYNKVIEVSRVIFLCGFCVEFCVK